MAGVAVFAEHGTFDGRVNVGVIEHDERRVATELKCQFFDAGRGLRHQNAADFGGAGEADVAHRVAGAKHFADGDAVVTVGAQHVQHTGGNTGAYRQLGRGQRGQRREFSRLNHHRATGGQCRRDFARDHGQREIPRRDGGAHTDGLIQHQQAAVVAKLRQRLAVHAFGFFGVPLNKTRAISDFPFGFRVGLALFGGEYAGQIVGIGHQQIKPFAQNLTAFLGGFVAPRRPGGVGRGNGFFCVGRAEVGHICQLQTGARVLHLKTAVAFDPFAVDQRIGFQQSRVFQQSKRRGFHVHGVLSIGAAPVLASGNYAPCVAAFCSRDAVTVMRTV